MRQPPLLNRSSLCIAIAIVGSALAHTAPTLAQSSEAAPAVAAAPSTPAAPPPYSLPWQLRPAAISTSLRSDTSFAFYDNAAHHGALTIPTWLTACYKLSDTFAPMLRVGVVDSSPGSGAKLATGAPLGSAVAVTNPIVGGTYLLKLRPDLRLAFFLGASIPIGSGGGNKPDAATKAARLSGIPARSSMDNALFTADDFAIIPGLDLAYVDHGLTVQAEASVLQLTRVRGDQVPAPGKPASNPDASKTNLILGLHEPSTPTSTLHSPPSRPRCTPAMRPRRGGSSSWAHRLASRCFDCSAQRLPPALVPSVGWWVRPAASTPLRVSRSASSTPPPACTVATRSSWSACAAI